MLLSNFTIFKLFKPVDKYLNGKTLSLLRYCPIFLESFNMLSPLAILFIFFAICEVSTLCLRIYGDFNQEPGWDSNPAPFMQFNANFNRSHVWRNQLLRVNCITLVSKVQSEREFNHWQMLLQELPTSRKRAVYAKVLKTWKNLCRFGGHKTTFVNTNLNRLGNIKNRH